MNFAAIGGLLARHAATAVGGGTVAAADSTEAQVVGAIITLAGLGWSFWQKKKVGLMNENSAVSKR